MFINVRNDLTQEPAYRFPSLTWTILMILGLTVINHSTFANRTKQPQEAGHVPCATHRLQTVRNTLQWNIQDTRRLQTVRNNTPVEHPRHSPFTNRTKRCTLQTRLQTYETYQANVYVPPRAPGGHLICPRGEFSQRRGLF